MIALLPICVALLLVGCTPFGPDDGDTEPRVPLNVKLKQVLYFGYSAADPLNDIPNQVYPAESIEVPVWPAANKVYAYSRQIIGGEWVVGIFEITIDPVTFDYISHTAFEFGHDIWTLGYDPGVGKLLVIYSDQDGYQASYLSISQGLLKEETLIPPSWSPWGIAGWPQRSGVIFYGRNPANRVAGFYWHHVDTDGATRDSLLYSITVSQFAARGMSVRNDGRYLFFTHGDRYVQFFQMDLTQAPPTPTIIAERNGGSGQIIPNPAVHDLLLINYSFRGDATRPPQSHIELLNTATMTSNDLNVRTTPLLHTFVINDHPWWSPDGRHFVYSAGFFTGETGPSPMTLWAYRDVP